VDATEGARPTEVDFLTNGFITIRVTRLFDQTLYPEVFARLQEGPVPILLDLTAARTIRLPHAGVDAASHGKMCERIRVSSRRCSSRGDRVGRG